ncbi:hypothetical protein BD289DRAFT_438065 [Coniella lustricola]|uniref:Pentatricopeptide repeat protein n=1 Tax=Coniella lustricola TaxID=2025994 RepID=A0A2T3A3D2_9PEZI|nr:hypothetical protein BD289DRAFT_438065 [Coniella lustricola]
MPPRAALLDVANCKNSYICRPCLALLAVPSSPVQRFTRGYAFRPKGHKPRAPPLPKDIAAKSGRPVIRYFDKDPETGKVTPRQPLAEEDDDEDEPSFEDIRNLEAETTAKMDKLDELVPKLEKKSAGLLERILEKHGPPGSLEALERAMKSYDYFTGGDSAEDDGMPRIQLSMADFSNQKYYLRAGQAATLSQKLELAMKAKRKDRLTRLHITLVWKYLAMLTPALLKPNTIVPQTVWDALWTVLTCDSNENVHRLSRIRELSRMMTKAGVSLSLGQQLLAIEATFESGHRSEARDAWKRAVASLQASDPATAMPFYAFGVRMWCALGDLERAERTSRSLLEMSSPEHPADSRVLLHLIRAYCEEPDTAEKGFILYRRMRELATQLEKPMVIEDYDDVISIFLTSGHTDYAMYAFTDMMLAGTVNLYGKAKLPNEVRNGFFFGKWLKRLIGAGDVDSAYQVLIFMQKNGVMAASIQVNGLLGAWLRTGTVEYRDKAERLAWSMIRSRKTFVELRDRQAALEWPMKLVDNRPNRSDHEGPDLDYYMVPRATVETFVILAEMYREREMFGRLEELFVAFKECAMPDDSMMMNELLAAAVAQNRGDKAQKLYDLMVREHDIVPNIDTFVIMFRALAVNQVLGIYVNNEVHAAASRQARDIFRDLLSSSWIFAGHFRANRGKLSETQVKLVLHSFRKANDWAGVVAVLQALRDVMEYKLTRGVVLEMLAEQEGIERQTPRMVKLVIRATLKLQERLELLKSVGLLEEGSGENGTSTAAESMKQPRTLYEVLIQYYYSKVQQMYPHDATKVQEVIAAAKEEMGVPGPGIKYYPDTSKH